MARRDELETAARVGVEVRAARERRVEPRTGERRRVAQERRAAPRERPGARQERLAEAERAEAMPDPADRHGSTAAVKMPRATPIRRTLVQSVLRRAVSSRKRSAAMRPMLFRTLA